MTPTCLRGAFREDDTNDNNDGGHGAVDVWDALPAGRRGSPVESSLLSWSDGLPKGPIVGNNRGKGRRGEFFTDETTTDRVRTTATTEQGIHR